MLVLYKSLKFPYGRAECGATTGQARPGQARAGQDRAGQARQTGVNINEWVAGETG